MKACRAAFPSAIAIPSTGDGFRVAIEEGQPWAVMTAYNRIHGERCTANAHLNRKIFNRDFAFDGANVSDWGAWHDDKKAIEGGCTLEMPSTNAAARGVAIADRVRAGEISAKAVDKAVWRNLRLAFRIHAPKAEMNTPAHQALARRVATARIVY